MPKIPVYEQQINPTQPPAVRVNMDANPAAFGAQLGAAQQDMGQGMQQVGNLMMQRAVQLQEQENIRKVMELKMKINTDYMNKFYTGDNAILKRDGTNALEDKQAGRKSAYQDADDFLRTKENEYLQLAENNHQRDMLKNYLFEHNELYRRNSAIHQAKQSDIATQAVLDARIEQAGTMALTTYNNPEMFQANLTALNKEVTATLLLQGIPKEVIQQKLKAVSSKVIAGAAEMAINNRDLLGAQQILDRYSSAMDPLVASKYKAAVNEQIGKEEKYMLVNDISQDRRFFTNGTLDETKASAYIREMKRTIPGSADGAKVIAAGEKQLGLPYQLGGDGVGSTDCGQFTMDSFKQVGVNLGTRAADGQYRNLETKGATFSDRKQLKEGDLVFFSGTSTRWLPSDDPAAVNDSGKAYKGITHVGIYAGNGKVLQAGSKGVDYADMDSIGQIAGYGRALPEGNSGSAPAYTQEEIAWLDSHIKTEAGRQREAKRRDEQYAYETLLDKVYSLDGSPTEQLKAIDEANIPVTKKMALRKSIVEPLASAAKKEAKDTAIGALSELHSSGRLTVEDVHNVANALDKNSVQQWLSKARASERGAARSKNDTYDEMWISMLPSVPGYENDKAQDRKRFIGALVADMDNNGLQGNDRYLYATDRIKNKTMYKDALVSYDKKQTEDFATIIETYGQGVADAVNAGWVQERIKDPKAAAPNYATTLIWLAEAYQLIEQEGWNGPTGLAMTRTLGKGLPLERDLFWQRRDEYANQMGWKGR